MNRVEKKQTFYPTAGKSINSINTEVAEKKERPETP